MQDVIFDTEAKRKKAVLAFRGLLEDPGWILVVQVADANIENLREQLEDPESEDTKEEIDMKRRLLRFYRGQRNLPQDKIREFTTDTAGSKPNDDPYDVPTLPEKT